MGESSAVGEDRKTKEKQRWGISQLRNSVNGGFSISPPITHFDLMTVENIHGIVFLRPSY